jgi:hypothetical protein
MTNLMNEHRLQQENVAFHGTGGLSHGNRGHGFRPAFFDMETGAIYPSCFANGTPAPFHMIDGLPTEVIVERDVLGRPSAVKASVVSGFTRNDRFYSREEAAEAVSPRAPSSPLRT